MHPLGHLLRNLLLTTAILLPTAVGETYTVYLPEGAEVANVAHIVRKLLQRDEQQQPVACEFKTLPYKCRNSKQAEVQAEAMAAGVTHLPCLVIADDQGPFATLVLRGLKRADIKKAAEQATAADRYEKAKRREFNAGLYLLFARCEYEEKTPETLSELVNECHILLSHDECSKELQQLIGLRCLYPLLMKQYAIGHQGAHTPETEAKLLEAIAALEQARDIAPDSALGKRAHDERHRLRMARRKARQYE